MLSDLQENRSLCTSDCIKTETLSQKRADAVFHCDALVMLRNSLCCCTGCKSAWIRPVLNTQQVNIIYLML